MRTYEFTCSGCGKTVSESVSGFEGAPERCRECVAKAAGPVLGAAKPPAPAKPPAKPLPAGAKPAGGAFRITLRQVPKKS